MARFSDLPPELVLNILLHVDPRSLVTACILSKVAFLLAAPILEKHRRLTKEFSTAFVDTRYAIPLHDFFAKVLAKPQNPDYVRNLTVGLEKYWCNGVMSDRSGASTLMEVLQCKLDNPELIRTAIQNTKHICTNETDVWLQAAQHNPEDTICSLLILYLPNLERLELTHYTLIGGYASRLTEAIRDAPTSKYLCHLRHLTIDFPSSSYRWGRSEYLKFVTAFLSLPSLAFCCVENLKIEDDESDPRRYLRPHESAVHEIQFHHCCIGPKTLFEILEGIKCLSSISYTSDFSVSTLKSRPLDWYWVTVGLWRYARHSLEKVVLNPAGSVHAKLCDFREFTSLREIEAEMALLVSDNSLKAQSFPWMLPASLHILRLRFRTTDSAQRGHLERLGLVEQIKDVIHIILKVKQVLLPLLTEIQLFSDCCVPALFLGRATFLGPQVACNLQGISLSLVEPEEYSEVGWT